MTVFWVSIVVGLFIVACVVGIPYWFTHRRLRPHHDNDTAAAYLKATGKSPEDAGAGRPGDPDRREGSAGERARAIEVAAVKDDGDPRLG
jgi:hypothetical protein